MDIQSALQGFVQIVLADLRVFLIVAMAAAGVIGAVFVVLGIARELTAYNEDQKYR